MQLRDAVTGQEYAARVVKTGETVGGYEAERTTVFLQQTDRWIPLKADQKRFVGVEKSANDS